MLVWCNFISLENIQLAYRKKRYDPQACNLKNNFKGRYWKHEQPQILQLIPFIIEHLRCSAFNRAVNCTVCTNRWESQFRKSQGCFTIKSFMLHSKVVGNFPQEVQHSIPNRSREDGLKLVRVKIQTFEIPTRPGRLFSYLKYKRIQETAIAPFQVIL